MKAKHLKQHIAIINADEQEDEWGDQYWVVNGCKYKVYAEAVKAAKEEMELEFRARYLQGEGK